MKASIFSVAVLSISALLFADYKNGVYESAPHLKVYNHAPDVKLPEPVKLENKDSFTMLVLGDPQSYMKFDFNQPLFEHMTAWCAAQKRNLNVKTVLCTGDLVEQNEVLSANGGKRYKDRNGNQPSVMQWKAVSRAFERLDNVYAYVLSTGNHDHGLEASETRTSQLSKYFDMSRNFQQWRYHVVSAHTNSEGKATFENTAYEFYDKTWGKLLVISMEFSPRNEVVDWAKKLCNTFKEHKVIILTHSVITTKAKFTADSYKTIGNRGADLNKKLFFECPNIKLVVCGHCATTKDMTAFRQEKNKEGKNVSILMFNPQAISGWFGNGGDGWVQILEFYPDGKTISVRAFSPLFGASQKTYHLAWEKSPANCFKFQISE